MDKNASELDPLTGENSFFDFRRKPFSMRFDSEFFWTNPRYDIIYNHLLNGIHQCQGVMALTGEAGTGKTFLLRELMQETGADKRVDIRANIQFVFCNYFSNLDFDDLLNIVCGALDLTPQGSSRLDKLKALSDYLNSCFRKGISTTLLIDEAHNLDEDVVSHLVTLSRSGFKDGRSLQIVLSGLPLLGEKLTHWKTLHRTMTDVLENRLEPLTTAEVAAFIRHQLQIAGGPNKDLFPEPVLESIAHHARVPRLINMFCDRALRMAQAANQARVSPAMIDEIADELLLSEPSSYKPLESVVDSLNPATAPKTENRSPIIHSFVQADAQAAAKTAQATGNVFWVKPSAKEKRERRSTVQSLDLPAPNSRGVANQHAPRRRRRAWIAMFLIISIGAAGSYALQQHYGPDKIAGEAKQALDFIHAQWVSISSKIMGTTQVLKSEIPPPPEAPEITQHTPLPPGASSIPNTTPPLVQQAVPPPKPRTDMQLMFQSGPAAELSSMASEGEAPVLFEEISDSAKQALEVIESQWSSVTSRIIASTQALRPEIRLPPPASSIVRDNPLQIEATDITEAAALEAQQVDFPEPSTEITLGSQTEPVAALADIASVVEAPLEDPAMEENLAETDPATNPEIEQTQTANPHSLLMPVSVPPEIYMRKGDELFELSDMASARLYYEAAVNAGHAAAMIAVGKTYDPLVVNRLAIKGAHAEPIKAAEWYRKASQAGVPEASERLDNLQHWLADSPPLGEAEGIALQQLLQR